MCQVNKQCKEINLNLEKFVPKCMYGYECIDLCKAGLKDSSSAYKPFRSQRRQWQSRFMTNLFQRKTGPYFVDTRNRRELFEKEFFQRSHVGHCHADQVVAVAGHQVTRHHLVNARTAIAQRRLVQHQRHTSPRIREHVAMHS